MCVLAICCALRAFDTGFSSHGAVAIQFHFVVAFSLIKYVSIFHFHFPVVVVAAVGISGAQPGWMLKAAT